MSSADLRIGRLTLVGVGLIGGSLARSLKGAGVVDEVVGVARTRATLEKARDLGVIDRGEASVEAAAEGADVVVIATPMQSMPRVLAGLHNSLDDNAIVSDVGSVKGFVIEAARAHLADKFARFVPAHPIAGREHAGVEASREDLFQEKTVILTPTDDTDREAVESIGRMWRMTGASVTTLDAAAHDRLLAATSHLPHMAAYALVSYLARQEESTRLFELAAGGFYDFTRIASSDPVMWRDICLTNRDEILKVLKGYQDTVQRLFDAIQSEDGNALRELFEHAKLSRDSGLHNKNGPSKRQG